MSCHDEMNSNWKRLGDHKLHHVQLVSNNNQVVDIKSNITKMNVYRDIFGVFMSATISFTDAAGYVEKLPLTGNEMVRIKFQTPGTDVEREFEFYIYSIRQKERSGPEAKEIVTIDLCSLEMIANGLSRISRSVVGKQCNIVKNIWDEQFAPLGKQLYVEPCTTEIKMVIPSWKPVETFCWLSNTAVSLGNQSPSYVFYEDTQGFNFKTIESLKGSAPRFSYYSGASVTNDLDLDYNSRKVLKMRDFKSTNSLSSILSGSLGMKTLYHDPLNKTVVDQQYEVDVGPTMSRESQMLPDALKNLSSNNSGFVSMRNVVTDLYDEGDRPVEGSIPDWEGRRKSYFTNLLNNRVNIVVTGNTMIDIGDIVELIVSNNQKEINRKDSGHYIVTAINDQFDTTGHIMSVELATDGFNEYSGGIDGQV